MRVQITGIGRNEWPDKTTGNIRHSVKLYFTILDNKDEVEGVPTGNISLNDNSPFIKYPFKVSSVYNFFYDSEERYNKESKKMEPVPILNYIFDEHMKPLS